MQSRGYVETCKASQISIQEFGKASRKETMLEVLDWYNDMEPTNWAGANADGITDPNGQLTWIDSVTVPAGQWIPTGAYPLSFDQFKVSGESPEISEHLHFSKILREQVWK